MWQTNFIDMPLIQELRLQLDLQTLSNLLVNTEIGKSNTFCKYQEFTLTISVYKERLKGSFSYSLRHLHRKAVAFIMLLLYVHIKS